MIKVFYEYTMMSLQLGYFHLSKQKEDWLLHLYPGHTTGGVVYVYLCFLKCLTPVVTDTFLSVD